jgi:threonyl-tRNA synthetase
MKVPYTVVVGEKEVKSRELSPRIRSDMQVVEAQVAHPLDNFLNSVANEAKSRTTKSSL